MGEVGTVNVSNFFISLPQQMASGTALKVLADVTLAAPAATLSSGVFDSTGYKTLKVFATHDTMTGAGVNHVRLNNDSGADRHGWYYFNDVGHDNDGTDTSWTLCWITDSAGSLELNINNSTVLMSGIYSRAGAGIVVNGGSYNQAGPLTQIDLFASANSFPAGSRIIVMGV